MKNMPYPFDDELTYSVIARAKARFCYSSPKGWNKLIFNRRSIISTVEFPSNLSLLAKQFEFAPVLEHELIYLHTLFPLYAPFIPEHRRQQCIKWMKNKSNGGIHVASGKVASRLPQLSKIRFCPACLKEQLIKYGEPFWQRIHQVVGVGSCTLHKVELLTANYCQSKTHRHEFYPANQSLCDVESKTVNSDNDIRVYQQIQKLLTRPESESPSYDQWTAFYKELIKSHGCNKGNYVYYDAIKERLLAKWSYEWLKQYNLHHIDGQSSWVHGLTRKHRKSFSYLEHIIILDSFLEDGWSINDVIDHVLLIIPSRANVKQKHYKNSIAENIRCLKLFWLKNLKSMGTKKARKTCAGSTYMKLYRQQRDWLLNINKRYQRPIEYENTRVDWQKRDKSFVKELVRIRNRSESDLSLPWISKKWYINQLPTPSSIEKRLAKLPLTNKFLNRYAETITEYQVRRIAKVTIENDVMNVPLWILLRKAGLSKERMTKTTEKLMRFAWGLNYKI